ncbi:hypothetical protein D9M71_524340 [compost metagenome]
MISIHVAVRVLRWRECTAVALKCARHTAASWFSSSRESTGRKRKRASNFRSIRFRAFSTCPVTRAAPGACTSIRIPSARHRLRTMLLVFAEPGSIISCRGTPCSMSAPPRSCIALISTEQRFSPLSAPITYSTYTQPLAWSVIS